VFNFEGRLIRIYYVAQTTVTSTKPRYPTRHRLPKKVKISACSPLKKGRRWKKIGKKTGVIQPAFRFIQPLPHSFFYLIFTYASLLCRWIHFGERGISMSRSQLPTSRPATGKLFLCTQYQSPTSRAQSVCQVLGLLPVQRHHAPNPRWCVLIHSLAYCIT